MSVFFKKIYWGNEASAQAKSMLNRVLGETYVATTILPDTSGQQGLLAPPPAFQASAAEGHFLEAVPNPAARQTMFHFKLPEETEMGELVVMTIDGHVLKAFQLEGNRGQVSWDTSALESGVFFYSLVVGHRKLETRRLIILK